MQISAEYQLTVYCQVIRIFQKAFSLKIKHATNQIIFSYEGIIIVFEMSYTFKETKGLKGLQSIKSDWQTINENIPDVFFFNQWSWYHSFVSNLQDDPDNVCFIVLLKDNKPSAILPYIETKEKKYGIDLNILRLPSHSHLYLYDMVAGSNDESAINLLIEHLKKKQDLNWDLFYASGLLEDSSLMQQLLLQDKNSIICRQKSTNAYMECSFEKSHMETLSKKFHRNIRRLQTRVRKKGVLSFDYATDPNELSGAYKEFLKTESAGWKGEKGKKTAICCSTNLSIFFKEIFEESVKKNECRINLMKIDSQCAAAQLCIVQNGVLYILKIGFNEQFKDVAPGILLLYNLLDRCSRDPAVHTVNLVTGPRWAKRWHTLEKPIYEAIITNDTVKGVIYNRLSKLKNHKWTEHFKP